MRKIYNATTFIDGLDAFQTISEICLACTAVLSAGTVHTHSFDVQVGFVSPFLFAASIGKSNGRSHMDIGCAHPVMQKYTIPESARQITYPATHVQ